jgi:Tfp pilus assembly protein PilX
MGRLRDERGIALLTAILVSLLLLSMGMALLAVTDQQSAVSSKARVQESTLTLSEGALNAQANLIGANWPTGPATAFTPCTQASTATSCPNAAMLITNFTNKDFGANGSAATWSISVRDNGLGNFYSDTATASQPAYDASGPAGVPDGQLWLRASATVRGRTRTVVAIVRSYSVGQTFPRGVVTAGKFRTSNNGKKVIVDTGTGAGIQVRGCTGPPARGNACLDYVQDKGQVWPNVYKGDTTIPDAMSTSEVDAMRTKAQALGKYYATCPNPIPSAPLVFVENGPCSMGGNTQVNSPASPGLLIINGGTSAPVMSLGGTSNFYGIIYVVNASSLTAFNVVDIGGNAQVQGAVVVDKQGGVTAGSSKANIVADENVWGLVSSVGNAIVVANTWRELDGH